MVRFFAMLGIILATGCARPIGYTERPMERYDQNTTYRIDSSLNGFTVTAFKERYQFIPESDVVAQEAKQSATAIAWMHADRTGRRIRPINPDRTQLSLGRNGLSGLTSCTVIVTAEWEP